ncbi:16S rRNA (cytidine(1402)-2'-O)-methyltransferase [Primorskyibacter marinus]|uniref:16S rRNA (cytidine(1402)-2'-O)-methyltransferase n=1 Tax=Primorskyibacter marinus TaxID=1977320 RepID=UPI000E306281|nr:16S rRNA (cytidine(1402)-2'-O)-methyltransferase [Primorskyibacter marinus]
MNPGEQKLAGGLYFVATPIGNARDITLRALDVLATADVLAAEDTRSLRKLMEIHGVSVGERPLLAYHDHNGGKMRPRIMAEIAAGKSVAYASEAGTPLISDPGFDLLRAAAEDGLPVHSLPGASAVLTALTMAGLPTDKFLFAGFLPNAKGQRKSALKALASVQATLVFYESPKRTAAMLADAAEVLGADRPAAMCRELTKRFEECRRGTLAELAENIASGPIKGEVVIVIGRGEVKAVSESVMIGMLEDALKRMSVRDAADIVAEGTGAPRRKVYQMALKLGQGDGPEDDG